MEDAPFSKLQILPADAKPISRWSDRDDAFTDIARALRLVVRELQATLAAKIEEWIEKGVALKNLKKYEEAIAAYDEVIKLDTNCARAYNNKGYALQFLGRDAEAQRAFEKARLLSDPG